MGLAQISPSKRPSMSPRAYAARVDLLRVQDLMDARMSVTEIAGIMKKDKSWVSKTIKKIQADRETEYQSLQERELVNRNHSILESLLAKALAVSAKGTTKERLAGAKVALDALRQKCEYEQSVGLVQRREKKDTDSQDFMAFLDEELPPEAVLQILKNQQIRAEKRKLRREQRACLMGAGTLVQPVAREGMS